MVSITQWCFDRGLSCPSSHWLWKVPRTFLFHVVRLLNGDVRYSVDCPCGVAFFAAVISAVRNRHVQAGTVILGDLTIQGNIKGPASITEPLQVALESGALRALVPVSNKTQFAGLPEDVIERLDVVFYGDIDRAVLKTLEI